MTKIIYLASPYTAHGAAGHARNYIENERYYATAQAAYLLARRDCQTIIYSPILQSVPMATVMGLEGTWEAWRDMDLDAIDACDELWVLMLPGWDESPGVAEEAAYAIDTGKRVAYIEPPEVSS